jgi:hypothetical protein
VILTGLACVLSAFIVLTGCTTTVKEGEKPVKKDVSILGYRLGSIPREDTIYKIHVPRFVDKMQGIREPHLQMEATNLLIDELTKEQTYYVVPRRAEADGILRVTLTHLKMSPTRYVETEREGDRDKRWDVPAGYQVQVFADVRMVNAQTSNTVWHAPRVRGKYEFLSYGSFLEQRREATMQACADLAREITETATERW